MHKKKLIAPIIISIIIILYLLCYSYICFFADGIAISLFFKILGGVIPLLLSGVCIYVLMERINEIRSGEEDDLSKY